MANKIQKTDTALFFLRMGIGIAFACVHGLPKLMGGAEKWGKLGENMQYLGISSMHVFWGFMAMLAEMFGGVCLILGILVRPAAALMLITMIVAAATTIHHGKGFEGIVEIMEISGGLICLLIAGGGNISVRRLFGK